MMLRTVLCGLAAALALGMAPAAARAGDAEDYWERVRERQERLREEAREARGRRREELERYRERRRERAEDYRDWLEERRERAEGFYDGHWRYRRPPWWRYYDDRHWGYYWDYPRPYYRGPRGWWWFVPRRD